MSAGNSCHVAVVLVLRLWGMHAQRNIGFRFCRSDLPLRESGPSMRAATRLSGIFQLLSCQMLFPNMFKECNLHLDRNKLLKFVLVSQIVA